MNIRLFKRICVILTILLFLTTPFSSISSTIVSIDDITTDDIDGFWQINRFNQKDLQDNNWQVDENLSIQNGKMTLKQTMANEGNIYDMRQSDNSFYFFDFLSFIQVLFPSFYFLLSPSDINMMKKYVYPAIRYPDENFFENIETDKPRNQIHLFKFKIDEDPDVISQINISWLGKSNNDNSIKLYYWIPYSSQIPSYFGFWNPGANLTSSNQTIWLNWTSLDEDPPIADGFLYVCIVAVPIFDQTCTIATDYCKVVVHSENSGTYLNQGVVISEEIQKNDVNSSWENLIWQQKIQSNAKVKYQVLYKNQTDDFVPVEHEYLSGNENYITSTQTGTIYTSLRQLPRNYTSLKIKATLFASSTYQYAPLISSWGVTWQNNQTMWVDYFNSSDPPLRIDPSQSEMVSYKDEKVSINPIFYNWPLIGFDSSNSRATDALPPETSDVEWLFKAQYSDYDPVGGPYQNAVIGEYLYFPTSNGRYIYQFNRLEDDIQIYQQPQLKVTIPDNLIVENTPAIGFIDNEEVVIVCTGNDYTNPVNENWKNKVIAFRDFSEMDASITNEMEPIWVLDAEDVNKDQHNICYQTAPIISDDLIYVSSYSGYQFDPPLVYRNNKILAIEIDTGKLKWHQDLSAGSYCSPSVIDNTVIVGCSNNNGPSVYAFNKNTGGDPLWTAEIGSIGRASPVIYNDIAIFITKAGVTKIKVVALDLLDEGKELWHHNITVLSLQSIGDISPAIIDNDLYIATVDGKLHKIEVSRTNKTAVWSKYFAPFTTSPTIADGNIYIGTNSGIYAIDGESGEKLWISDSVQVESSPVIVDGFLYCSYDGDIMCIGDSNWDTELSGHVVSQPIYLPRPSEHYFWNTFSESTTTVTGGKVVFKVLYSNKQKVIEDGDELDFLNQLTPIPQFIRLKAEFTSENSGSIVDLLDWGVSFFRNNTFKPQFSRFTIISETPLICRIKVTDDTGLLNSSAKYKLRYDNATQQNILVGYTNITTDFPTNSTNVETLQVNLSTLDFLKDNTSDINISGNISDLEIRFSIENINGTQSESQWYSLLESKDKSGPIFFIDSFEGQVNKNNPFPVLFIEAKDDPTSDNTTGINISSAEFRIKYNSTSDDNLQSSFLNASCNGTMGTKKKVRISADLSTIDDKDNITSITKIQFSIKDVAGNENQTVFLTIGNDSVAPTSRITNVDSIPSFVNASTIKIIVNATDNATGIKEVGLYYLKTGQTQWNQFQSKKIQKPFEWDFKIGSNDGGKYSLRSIATDIAGNIEEKEDGEVTFVFDPNKPEIPSFSSTLIFTSDAFNESEPPMFSEFTFRDDYLLETVSYRMNFEATNEWRQINTGPINKSSYKPNWNLTQSQWDMMEEDITYSIYFRLKDSLGNINTANTSGTALKIRKNFIMDDTGDEEPSLDLSDFDTWKWNNEYRIEVYVNDSSYQSLTLYYTYSEKNTTNLTWKKYNESFDNKSKSWTFKPEDGDGYYSFKIEMIDNQGSTVPSPIKTIYIQQFPLMELVIIIVLFIVLLMVTVFFYQKRKKTSI